MYSMLAWQLPQNAGDIGRRFYGLETGVLRMCGGYVRVGRIAAVTIRASKPLLPMDIAGEVLLGDEVTLLVLIPHVAVAVALDAEALLGRRLRRSGLLLVRPGRAADSSNMIIGSRVFANVGMKTLDSVQGNGRTRSRRHPTDPWHS